MTYSWQRATNGSYGLEFGFGLMATIGAGSTYRRIRFSWGLVGHTPTTVDLSAQEGNPFVMGLVTTIGNGSETPPDPQDHPGDVDPPTQRWVWWEARVPVVTAIDAASGVMTWRDSGQQEVPDVKTQVLATGLPAGDSLNLWASWRSFAVWPSDGLIAVWVATSVLVSTP